MSGLGAIRQLGFVVDDVRHAAEAWIARTGAGPFFVMQNVEFQNWRFLGRPQTMMMDIAFGQGGDVMIELIKPLGEWPNVYGEAPPRQGAVVPHHHGHLVADMDAAEVLLGSVTPVTTGTLGATAALRYYDMRETLGVFIETISDTEDARAFFALARDAAREWDGVVQPLRTMAPPSE